MIFCSSLRAIAYYIYFKRYLYMKRSLTGEPKYGGLEKRMSDSGTGLAHGREPLAMRTRLQWRRRDQDAPELGLTALPLFDSS